MTEARQSDEPNDTSAPAEEKKTFRWWRWAPLTAAIVFLGGLLTVSDKMVNVVNYFFGSPAQQGAQVAESERLINGGQDVLPQMEAQPTKAELAPPAQTAAHKARNGGAKIRKQQAESPAPAPMKALTPLPATAQPIAPNAGRDAYSVIVSNSPNANTNTTFNVSNSEGEQ